MSPHFTMQSWCESCAHVRRVVSASGSQFLLCQKSLTDRRFPKYPRQPVVRCAGFAPEQSLPDSETSP